MEQWRLIASMFFQFIPHASVSDLELLHDAQRHECRVEHDLPVVVNAQDHLQHPETSVIFNGKPT